MDSLTYSATKKHTFANKILTSGGSDSKKCLGEDTNSSTYTEVKEAPQMLVLFEFGINANAHNKQAIGGFEALTKHWEIKRGNIGDLVAWVGSGRPIMCGTLADTNTRRQKSNIVSAQAIALDIDDGLSIEDCLKFPFVKDYAAAIYTSSSHQQQKGDKPACDRYRVIFVLPEAVTDTALYEAAVALLMERVSYADRACKDASRMFFGYDKTEVMLCDNTKVLPAAFIEEARDRLEAEKLEKQKAIEERRRYQEQFEVNGEEQLSLIQQALDHVNPDCGYDEWLTVMLALHSHDPSLFWLFDGWSSRGSKYPGSRNLERQWSKLNSNGGVTVGSLFHIAKDYGFKFPERRHQPKRKRKGDRLIDGLSFAKARVSEFIQKITGEAAGLGKKAHKGFAVGQLPPVEPPNVFRWNNGDPVPTRGDYAGRPIPKIVYARGANPQELISKLRAAGWDTVLDSSFMGEGKTHRAGTLYFENERGIYLDPNHNSPSVENVEKNYQNLWPRHKGLWRDEFGKLSRHGKGKAEVPSNCDSAHLFSQLADKGYGDLLAGDNPICEACSFLPFCHTKRGVGFGHKYERGLAMAAQQIRADIQSLPSTSEDEDYSSTYLIVEEATTQARANLKQFTGGFKDLLYNLDQVERHDKDVYAALLPLRDALRGLDDGTIQSDRYGVTHAQIIETLPPVPANTEGVIPMVAAALMPIINLEKADRVSGAGKEYKQATRTANRQFRTEALEANEQRLDSVPNNVLLPLVELWLGDHHTHVSFNHGEFTITQPDTRKQEIIKAAGFRLLLDATPNMMAIAHGLGINQNNIIEIQQELPALDNLTVYQTNMTGIKTRQRSESAKKRIAAYKAQWQETDPAVQFLGFKGEDDIAGYWHNHHRGSNQFKGQQSLVSFGLPFLHIGAVQAEYHALTGGLDGWETYYQELVRDEVTQWIGRPRAQRYPDLNITVDMVATFDKLDLSFLTERYGIKVMSRDAVEFCHDAGTTKEKLETNILGIATALNDAGTKLTQQAIAQALGISQSTLSEHLKAIWGNWLKLKQFLSENLYRDYRETDKTEPTNMASNPIVAASLLIELFSFGGWEEMTQFLRTAPPPERQKYLAALLKTAAIA
ncbi:PriCT-2 domain-containing protein [Synechococcus sp. BDU 130192]|uniref:PriCT-2 domain-containing protein n=1 Tax=Synechococcus sp. BDU 130192 TaxID=2042059 RepID=UPI000C08C3EE|nr:PriCT-2 domain-containing protein [Synechococcus sp. BDU 130192]